MKKIIELAALFSLCLFCGCSSKDNAVSLKSSDTLLFEEVLEKPPSPAEVRIVGGHIDGLFEAIARADQNYIKEITKIKWGDVYDAKVLNSQSKLKPLLKVNEKSRKLSLKAFESRAQAYANTFAQLSALESQSIFAKAMLQELKQRYEASETGFLAVENEMRDTTLKKLQLIDEKLEMLSRAPNSYKIMSNGETKFAADSEGEKLMHDFVKNNTQHNQLTDRQRKLGEFFINHQKGLVSRFHELSRQ